MTIALYAPWAAWAIHSQVDHYLCKALRDRGFDADVVVCNGRPDCDLINGPDDCARCQSTQSALNTIFQSDHRIIMTDYSEPMDAALLAELDSINSAEAMANFRYDGAALGLGCLATASTKYRISTAMFYETPVVMAFLKKFLLDSVDIYRSFRRYIRERGVDTVVLFNGRISPYYAALCAAKAEGCRVYVHERAELENSYQFFNDRLCHDTSDWRPRFLSLALGPLCSDAYEQATNWVKRRISGDLPNWHSFYGKHSVDAALPPLLEPFRQGARPVIGVFTSSHDELACFGDEKLVRNHVGLVRAIAQFAHANGCDVIVRHHPNIGPTRVTHGERDMLPVWEREAMEYPPNVMTIHPTSDIKSYDVMKVIDLAVIFSSSIVAEFSACAVPTVTHRNNAYGGFLDDAMCYEDAESLVALLGRWRSGALKIDPTQQVDTALKFIYAMLLCKSARFQGIAYANFTNPIKLQVGRPPLLAGSDPTLDLLIHAITHRSDFLPEKIARAAEIDALTPRAQNIIGELVEFRAKQLAAMPRHAGA